MKKCLRKFLLWYPMNIKIFREKNMAYIIRTFVNKVIKIQIYTNNEVILINDNEKFKNLQKIRMINDYKLEVIEN